MGLIKKLYVLWGPIISNTPIKNKRLPNASNARSNNVKIPNKKNRQPPKVNATPNSKILILVT